MENSELSLISLEDFCQQMMIGKSLAYRLLNSGEIQGAFKLNRIWKIPQSAVYDYLKRKSK